MKSNTYKIIFKLALIFSVFLMLFMVTSIVQAEDGTPTPTTEDTEVTVTPEPEEPDQDIVIPTSISHPIEEGANSCYECHIELGEEEHAIVAVEWEDSVHGNAGVICAACHGGDPRSDEMGISMSEEAGFIGAPSRSDVPGICGSCHADAEKMQQYNLPTDQYSKYITSVHGNKIAEGDTRVAICSDCHGSHDVKKVSDPASPAYILNIPELCSSCHSDINKMESYGIPTDQYDVYKNSVHGQMLLEEQDMRAPNCASCHGSHAADPPETEEVINICGKCHTATQSYYEESLHSRIGEAAPKCWTCHGTHDVAKSGEYMFLHPEPQDQPCGACHLDDEKFRMGRERFEFVEDRKCDTCHHPDSWINTQVNALYSALSEAAEAYESAEIAIEEAASRGMIVTEAEVKLAEANTSLISARATLHTTKLSKVTELTDAAVVAANDAKTIATEKLGENTFRRQAMIVVIVIIGINIGALKIIKKQLDKESK